MEETFGIFIVNKKGQLLICRPTGIKGTTGWTIPKGKREGKETDKSAALRETWEETGLELNEYRKDMQLLSTIRYKSRRKRITGFILFLDKNIDKDTLKCDCVITGKDRPEIDQYEWVEFGDAITRIHEAQARMLQEYIARTNNDDNT